MLLSNKSILISFKASISSDREGEYQSVCQFSIFSVTTCFLESIYKIRASQFKCFIENLCQFQLAYQYLIFKPPILLFDIRKVLRYLFQPIYFYLIFLAFLLLLDCYPLRILNTLFNLIDLLLCLLHPLLQPFILLCQLFDILLGIRNLHFCFSSHLNWLL